MAFRRDPDAGRKAITWLAVSFTLTTGVLVCSFIILAFAENQPRGFLVLGAVMVGILFFLWTLSTSRERNASRSWLLFWRRTQEPPDPAELYQPRRRHRSKTKLGSNQPPSAEQVRELADRHARWVPHGPMPKKDRQKRSK